MRARFGGSGLVITLYLEDKEAKKIECNLPEWKKPKLILHVVDEVGERRMLEEPGFHIEAIPRNVSPEYRTQYYVYLSEEKFRDLTNPSGDPIVEGGYFASRSMYDRVDIMYWGV